VIVPRRETQRTPFDLIGAANLEEEMGMQNAHISALEVKHADLETRIGEENQRPHPDMATLARLKKEKLRVKEAITGI
jgi:hypothetical protein